MCGRFTLFHPLEEIRDLFEEELLDDDDRPNTPARYNIAPTQDVFFIANRGNGNKLTSGRWWLVPHWAKELQSKYPMFNARSEDAHQKPAFREAFKSKRCLVLADGYYEWTKGADGGRDPHYIYLPGNELFAFAGLWAVNTLLGITSCTILTAAAAPEIETLHHRMPIILNRSAYRDWLNGDTSVDDARELLTDNRGAELISHPVSRAVNKSGATGSELIEAV